MAGGCAVKHGKRSTRAQKKLIGAAGLRPEDWLVVKALPREIWIVRRDGTERRMILLE